MFNDVVTYCEDTESLVKEVMVKYPQYLYLDEEDYPSFVLPKTKILRNGLLTLTLVRVSDEELKLLDALDSLEILGTFDEIKADADKLKKYDSVYLREDLVIVDPDLGEFTIKQPFEFGALI